jgi:hypothetical protein
MKGLAVSCFMAENSREDFHRVQKSLLRNTGNFDGFLKRLLHSQEIFGENLAVNLYKSGIYVNSGAH